MMDQSGNVLPRNGLAENKVVMGSPRPSPARAARRCRRARWRRTSPGSSRAGSASISVPTSARPRPARRCWGWPRARRLRRSWTGCGRSSTPPCGAARSGLTTALIYPPSSYHSTDELIELAKVAAKYGGIYASHIRGEGKELLTSIAEAIRDRRGRGHAGGDVPPQGGLQAGLGQADARGRRAGRDGQGTRGRRGGGPLPLHGGRHGPRGDDPVLGLPRRHTTRSASGSTIRRPGPASSARSRPARRGGGTSSRRAAAGRTWSSSTPRNPANTKCEGKSIAEIAKAEGKDPRDAAWDLVLQGGGRVTAIYHMMSEPDMRTALAVPVDQHRQRRRCRPRARQGRGPACPTRGATATFPASSPSTSGTSRYSRSRRPSGR